MSLERDVSVAVQAMFMHSKAVISKNLTNAVRSGQITIDEARLPGLDLLIKRSIDDSFRQSSRELSAALKKHKKSL